MKKTHWLRNTLAVLIACGLIGTVLAGILFFSEGTRTFASASILFSFEGAGDGKAPNGYPFDLSGFSSDEVLDEALEQSGLAGVYTAEQLRENLTVKGVYPEGIAEKMTKYVSLLDTDADNLAALTDYYATQYSVTLYNDFDKSISAGRLKELLGNIMAAYRVYFAKTYSANLSQEAPIADLPDYDYAQQMEAISESVDQQIRYAEEIKELAKDFRQDGAGFGDIVTRYRSLKGDINRLSAAIQLDAVSKDRARLQERYEMEIRELEFRLESLKEELKQVEAQVNAYDKDGIIYVSTNGSLNQVGGTSQTYDRLVEARRKVTNEIAQTKAKITQYRALLDDVAGTAAETAAGEDGEAPAAGQPDPKEQEELNRSTEEKIEALVAKKQAVENDFAAMLDAYSATQINEQTVKVGDLTYKTPTLLSGAFILKAIRTAGPICAVGFIVCVALLIRSRKKEEKA